jgi:hypothetical protein
MKLDKKDINKRYFGEYPLPKEEQHITNPMYSFIEQYSGFSSTLYDKEQDIEMQEPL